MDTQQVVHLEQALVAVLAAAEQAGLDADAVRQLATGGLIGNTSWKWVSSNAVPGAVEEIERAVRVLRRSQLGDREWE